VVLLLCKLPPLHDGDTYPRRRYRFGTSHQRREGTNYTPLPRFAPSTQLLPGLARVVLPFPPSSFHGSQQARNEVNTPRDSREEKKNPKERRRKNFHPLRARKLTEKEKNFTLSCYFHIKSKHMQAVFIGVRIRGRFCSTRQGFNAGTMGAAPRPVLRPSHRGKMHRARTTLEGVYRHPPPPIDGGNPAFLFRGNNVFPRPQTRGVSNDTQHLLPKAYLRGWELANRINSHLMPTLVPTFVPAIFATQ
jgi:hypothetical protein